jgi:hypothetical protein
MRSPLPARPSVSPHEPPRVCSPAPPTAGCPWLLGSAWSPPPRPAASIMSSPTPSTPRYQARPQQLDFSNAPSPRVVIEPQVPPPRVVIGTTSAGTSYLQAHLLLHSLQGTVPTCSLHSWTDIAQMYYLPHSHRQICQTTAKHIGFAGLCKSMHPAEIDGFAYLCQALMMQMSSLQALLVLDPSTGKFLEHRQLRRDPRYKATWDMSYTNELGWL